MMPAIQRNTRKAIMRIMMTAPALRLVLCSLGFTILAFKVLSGSAALNCLSIKAVKVEKLSGVFHSFGLHIPNPKIVNPELDS